MNLYNNEDENKGGAPVLKGGAPFKKSSIFGRTPMLSRAAGGIMDRLKNLSRRDMAFVGVGLSVLIMAPVAEYVMSKPSSDNLLAPGFGSRDGSAISGLYEPGINALSQGSSDGSGEVISPLSFRDPASLILGSQPAQAPAMAAPPPDMGMRDAMKDSGRAAFSAAAQSAGLPTVIPKMQSALRGVSSFAGGGEGSRTSGGLSGKNIIDDAKSASSKAAKRSMVGPVGGPGYKGIASNTPNSASKSALEKLRSQADKSAGNFSGGSAASALDKAAADAVSIGSGDGGFGSGGEGDKGKSPSNSTNKNSHSSSGESLAAQAAKARQAKALEWEFFKQYEIPKQIITAILTGFTGSLTKFVGGITDDLTGQTPGAAPAKLCWMPKVCSDADGCAAWIATYGTKPPYNLNPATAGPSDICSLAGIGAVSFSISPGKDGGTSRQVGTCICGEGPKPTPPGFPAGSNTVLPPPVVVVPPGTPDPASPYASYDQQLATMITLTVKGESEVANAVELSKTVASIVGGFSNLAIPANQVVTGLGNAAAANVTAHELYGRAVDNSQRGALEAATSVGLFRSKLDTIAAATNLKQRQVGGALLLFPEADAALIKAKAARDSQLLATTLASYNALVAKQVAFKAFYAAQNQRVNEGVAAIRLKLPLLKTNADAVVTAGGPALNQFKKITGKPQEYSDSTDSEINVTPVIPSNNLNQQLVMNFIPGDLRSAVAASIPLKDAVLVRGANWEALWQNPQHLLDDSSQTITENAAWVAFDAALSVETPVQPTDSTNLGNFASNGLRSAAVKTSMAANKDSLTALDGNAASLATLIEKMLTEYTSSNLNACYFTSSCDGTTPPVNPNPNNGGTDATFPDYKVTTLGEARTSLSSAAGVKSAAVAKNTTLQAFIPAAGKKAEMDGYKAQGAAALAKITASHEAIGRLVTEMEACTNRACVTGKKAAIAAETAKIEAARLELETAYTRAEAIKKQPVVAPTVTTVQIRQQAEDAYNRIVAAKGRADTSMSGFPTGTTARDEKKRLATEKMTALNRLHTDAGVLNTTAQNSATARAQVISARDSLRVKANSAETLATAIAALRTAANNLPSDNCWENAAGCPSVSSFYMQRKWMVRKQRVTAGIMYAEADGPEGMARDFAYENYKGIYASSAKERICSYSWSTVPYARKLLNTHVTLTEAQCDNWFKPTFEIRHQVAPVKQDEDYVSFLLRNPIGTRTKTYEGNGQNGLNVYLQAYCAPSGAAKVWKTTEVLVRVDQSVTNTYSQGLNISAGPSFLKFGAGMTQGSNTTTSFGSPHSLSSMVGKICGGDRDN